MTLRRISPGDQILPIDAATWNAFIDAANVNRGVPEATDQHIPFQQGNVAWAQNVTGNVIARFDVVGIEGSIFSGPAIGVLRTNALRIATSPAFGKIGIAVDTIRQQGMGKVWHSGLAVTDKLNVTQLWHTHCDYVAATGLTTHPAGSWRILERENSTGANKRAILRYEGAREVVLDSISPSTWSPNTSKTCTIYRGGSPTTWTQSVKFENWIGGAENISTGVHIRIRWSLDTLQWVVHEADCEPA